MRKNMKSPDRKQEKARYIVPEYGKFEWLYRNGKGKIDVLFTLLAFIVCPWTATCCVQLVISAFPHSLPFYVLIDALVLRLRHSMVMRSRKETEHNRKLEQLTEKEWYTYMRKKIDESCEEGNRYLEEIIRKRLEEQEE